MKASKLVEYVQASIEKFGDAEVYLETATDDGQRPRQVLSDVLANSNNFLLTSQEATDADPLNQLPIVSAH